MAKDLKVNFIIHDKITIPMRYIFAKVTGMEKYPWEDEPEFLERIKAKMDEIEQERQ